MLRVQTENISYSLNVNFVMVYIDIYNFIFLVGRVHINGFSLLFLNEISTFMGYLNPKPSLLLKNNSGII